jgi:hypothetical protein
MAKKNMTYSEKLLDPRWQKKRLEVLEGADWTCQICCENESTLHVHHKAYFKGRDPWDYEYEQLVVLCDRCHKEFHDSQPDLMAEVMSRLPLDGPCCRRDLGWVLAATLYPGVPAPDEPTKRVIRKMRQLKLDQKLFSLLWEIWGTVYREIAAENESEKK